VTSAGEKTTVTLSPAIAVSGGPAVGDLCLFGELNEESIPCLVSRIDPGPDLSARLALVEYNAAIYTADGGTIPAHNSHITIPPAANRTPPKPNIVSTHYSFKDSGLKDDGTYDIRLTVVFEAQAVGFSQGGTANDDNPDVIRGFQAEHRFRAIYRRLKVAGEYVTIDGQRVNLSDGGGDGEWIRLPQLAAEARQFEFSVQNGAEYDVRVRSFSLPGLYSDWDTESAIAISLSGTVPGDVSGLQVNGGGTSFTQADCEIEWTAVAGGGTAGLLVMDYKVEVRTSDGLTLLRTEYVTEARYSYTRAKNVADGGPRASLQFRVWARSKWGDLSANYASLTATNPAPAAPSSLGSRSWMGGVEFYWAANTEADFSHFTYRLKIGAAGSWGGWQRTGKTGVERLLSPTEKDTYGADATIYIEVKSVDLLGQESTASTDDEVCGSLNIQPTDIDDFAISASKLFVKIPICVALALTNNSPSAGYVAWAAFKIFYNGVEYSIDAGNSDKKYLYWKDLASSLTGSDTHPGDTLADWAPHEDFIIAVNISGSGQQAWNAIANQVIGSAYIMTAAIGDLQVSDLSGTKIRATTSIAIGSATWGNDGIQLEYNGGNPRFYAGDGANQFVKFDGASLYIRGAVEIIGSTPSNVLANPGFEDFGLYWSTGTGIDTDPAGNNSTRYLKLTRTAGDDLECFQTTAAGARRYWEVVPGDAYDVGCDVSTDGTCVAYAQLVFYDKDQVSIGASYSFVNGVTPAVWTQYTGRTTVPAGARFMAWRFVAYAANGVIGFDNCWLRKSDQLAYSWTASGDRTKIDGGNIYASSSVSIGSSTWGNDGIQLQYNSGNPRIYAGDGSNNYLKFDGSKVTLSTDGAEALKIKNGGSIRVEYGGDIILEGRSSNYSRLIFDADSPTSGAIMSLQLISGLPDTPYLVLESETDAATHLHVGTDSKRWKNAKIYAETEARLEAYYSSGRYGRVKATAGAADGSVQISTCPDGGAYSFGFYGAAFYPAAHKTQNCGGESYAWDHVFSDDFDNVADFYNLDNLDDMAVLKSIRGSGKICPETGMELIDDDTLPAWMLAHRDGEVVKDPDGKPYIRLKILLSLIMGALRQVDGKITAAPKKG
jgi:hypothetical protein